MYEIVKDSSQTVHSFSHDKHTKTCSQGQLTDRQEFREGLVSTSLVWAKKLEDTEKVHSILTGVKSTTLPK